MARAIDRRAEVLTSPRERYKSLYGCKRCKNSLPAGECCPRCGATFMSGGVGLYVVRQVFICPKKTWYNPFPEIFGAWQTVAEPDK